MNDDVFSSLLDEEKRQKEAKLAGTVTRAVAVNPDQAAAQRRAATYLGYPPAVGAADPTVVDQAKVQRVQSDTADAPVLQGRYTDEDFAKLAHDDSTVLSTLERSIGRALAYVMGARPGGGLPGDVKRAGRSLYSGLDLASGGAYGAAAVPFGLADQGIQALDDLAAFLTGTERRQIAGTPGPEGFLRYLGDERKDAAKSVMQDVQSADAGVLERGFYSGLQSAGMTMSQLPLAFVSPNLMLGVMGAESGGLSYLKAREAGKSPLTSTGLAAADATAEIVTEKYLGAAGLMKRLMSGAPASRLLMYEVTREIPGEVGATLWQNFNEWAVLNPEKSVQDFVDEQPEAIAETVVATIVGGGVQISAGKAAMKVAEKVMGQELESVRAARAAELLQEQLKVALDSKLRERDPEQFRALLQQMAAGTEGAPQSVFVDAEQLNQLPPEVLNTLPEDVLGQLADALVANSAVEIPIGAALAVAPGTPLEQALVDHGRVGDPSAPTRAEAQAASEQAGEFLQQQSQRVIQQAEDSAAMQASSDRVRQGILDQLTATGRFRQQVNEGYATWTAAFYTTMAGRTGMTPEQLAAKYPLRILGDTPAATNGTLNKGNQGAIEVDAYHFSTEARPVLSTAFYGTGLKGSARDEIMSYPDERVRKRLSFYVDKGTGIRPESGVGGVAHRVRLSNIYDANVDPLKLRGGSAREFETKVLDAGFSGYLDRLDGDQPGQVVVLGDQTFTPEVLGPRSRIENGEQVSALERREAPWRTQASGTPEQLQARLAKMQASPAWSDYELRIEGDELQAREQTEVFAQGSRPQPVPPRVAAVADISAAREVAGSRMWPTNRDFKLALQAAVRAATGRIDLTKDTPEVRAYMVQQLLKEAREALITNANAVGWYDDKVTTALEVVSAIHPELKTDEQSRFAFIWALAVTSNGVKVNKNFELAERAYTYWKANGVLPTANIGVGTAAGKIHEGLATYNDLIQKWGYDRLRQFATTLQPNRDIAATYGRKVSGEGLDTRVYGAGILGPKIGNGFFMNLFGEFGQLTMDRWWVRMWGRLTGDLVVVDREAIAKSRAAFISIIDLVKADKEATKVVEQALGTRLGKADPIALARAILRATAKKDVRDVLATVLPATPEREAAVAAARKITDFVSIGDELRKAAKSYYGTLDGQIEVPGGSRRRDMMRAVSQSVLTELQKDQPTLTMADFQALMWYPEKTLYDSAGAQLEDSEEGYTDDEAPDYANAAIKLARDQGISEADIDAAVERARSDIQARQRAGRSGRAAGDVSPSGGTGAGEAPGGVDGRLEQAGNRGGRYSSGGLAPLEGAPAVEGASGPDPRLVAVAEQYAASAGITLTRQGAYVEVDPERAARIAAAYEAMEHAPNDPKVKAAYDDLARQTMAQYQALVQAGYRFWFMDPAADPYKGNPWNAMRDLRANQSMAVFPSEAGFGTSEADVSGNPLLADTGLTWAYGSPDGEQRPVLFNDLFRAVHDAFGHGLEGAGFRARGEENAWQAHSRLFTGPALGAITSETRGQNSWLNYGPYGAANQTAKVEDTVFADQKTGLMPEWTWTEGRAPDEGSVLEQASTASKSRDITETSEFKKWFGDSKVVDAEGRPLVVYHGTSRSFDTFERSETSRRFVQLMLGSGFYFSPKADEAARYAQGEGANIIPVYLRLENPLRIREEQKNRMSGAEIDRFFEGQPQFDGVIFTRNGAVEEIMVRRPEQIKSAIGNDGSFDRDDPNILSQQARGTFTPKNLELALSPTADLSTFFHETGHFFLEVMADLASQPDAPAEIQADMKVLLDWFGVADLATWRALPLKGAAGKEPHHERFAESVEQYVLEGKAPSVELQPLFRRWRTWMLSVYRSLQNFVTGATPGPELSPEVRKVLDRMLASEEQIKQTEEVLGLVPEDDATQSAVERLTARSIRDLKWTVAAVGREVKKLQAQAAGLRKEVQAEVEAEVDAMPEFRAKAALDALQVNPDLSAGTTEWKAKRAAALADARDAAKAALLAANPEATGLKKGQLLAKNKRQLDNQAEAAALQWEQANPRPTAGQNASEQDLATVADSFGFADAETMLAAIAAIGKRADLVEAMTDQRILEEHGDLVDDQSIREAAAEAVHNRARAKSLATELRAQADLLGARADTGEVNAKGSKVTVNVLVEAAKRFAENVIGRTVLKDMKAKAWQHQAAERRAAAAWQKATAAGKTEEAVKAKQDQMLNHAAARAALDAIGEARQIIDFFRRVVKDGNEKTVEKGRDPDVVNAARAILAAYGVGPKAGKSALEYLEIVKQNDPVMFSSLEGAMQSALSAAQPLQALTMEQLQALHEEIQAMWHLAKRSRQMEVKGDLMDIDDAAQELSDRMGALGVPLEAPGTTSALTPAEERARWLQYAGSILRRVEQWAEGMDGKLGGPFSRLVFGPVKAAADAYRADKVAYLKRYQALVDNIAPALRKGLIEAPELGYTFGKGHNGIGHAELLHAILHTGNESNKRKLLLGRKWATENADGTIDTARWDAFVKRMQDTGLLRKEHYDFAQGVWDLLEQTKPLAQKAHRDVFGRYFAEVTADSFETPFGSYRGGYVPAQADPRIVDDANMRALAQLENESMSYSFPTTNKGFTKSRVEYNRPLILDLRTIGQHIDKVLLFSHMEPAVRDVNKLLSRKPVSQPLNKIDPTIYGGMLTPWLNRSARQVVETPIVGDGGISRVLSVLRARAGAALMFANVSNALQQLTGFSGAFAKLKADGLQSDMMRSTARFLRNPKKMSEAVAAASPYMAGRMKNEVAAMMDSMNEILLDPNLYQRAQAWTGRHAYFLQTALDNTMGPIIWTSAYNAGVKKGMSNDEAVGYADSVIRQTQGSTLPEDVSRIETGPAYARVFTQFIGYFNMVANTNGTALLQISREMGLKKGAGKALMVVTIGVLVPLWVAEAIAQGMRGGPEDEDGDGYLDDWLAAVFGMGTIKGTLAMVPFIGQLANAGLNRTNNNPADDKVSLSPAVSLLEASVGAPFSVYDAIMEEGNRRKAVRDVASLVSIATGLPATALARPVGYLVGADQGLIEPTGPVDAVRGAISGVPSPESKTR